MGMMLPEAHGNRRVKTRTRKVRRSNGYSATGIPDPLLVGSRFSGSHDYVF